ncbi:MAG: histidine--tRNA ligase [Candidatus Marinimicrobia bacterium]|nr:histidine--tRNA ligase [Candidatus Neomarinimicrobiota bacterium]MBL7009820.1 histidine--tRNA ligase [Candidatus Neomarinimicrobiota bacterium]MBL7029941.1 histidine--tRNA ligase [Candidatus Neomarinimicrobiota bacterium]
MTSIRSIKGTQDILPGQSQRWQALETTIRNIMDTYGYSEIRTPAFERTELFSRGVGTETDIVSKEMYSWTDQGGENLTLKPELTAPVVRSFIQHNLGGQSPMNKLYYIDALFRRERPQKGRYRQFHQFGIEAFGSEHPEIDAEVIALAMTVFNNIGLEGLTLKLNSIGSPECRSDYRNALRDFLKPHFSDLSETSQKRFENNPLRILDTKVPHEIEILKDAPQISDSWTAEDKTHFEEVCSFLDEMGIQYSIEPNLVRGLDYYTRTTFEITSTALGAQNAICGGGRYDGLVEMLGGKPTPGIGFAAGMERILLALGNVETNSKTTQVYIVGLGDAVRPTVVKLAEDLRHNNIRTQLDVLRRSMKAQMRDANKSSATIAVIIGDKELKSGLAEIKDLKTGDQEPVKIKGLVDHINSLTL